MSFAQEPKEVTPHEVESIVVEGTLLEAADDAPSNTTVIISSEELERRENDDIHQVLLKVPGVQIRGEDGFGLRPNIGIRGTSPNRSTKVTLTEDNVLLGPAPYSAPAAYYFPLVTRMTAVEVHKGGSQLLYGPRALGGAINLVTASIPEAGWGGYADVAMGEYGYKKVHARVGYGTVRTGFLLEAAHIDSSGFKKLDGSGGTGFDKSEFMAKWRIGSDPDATVYHQLDAKFGFAIEQSDETYLGLTDGDFENSPNRRYVASSLDQMNWQRGQAELSYSVFPSDSLEMRMTGYRHQFSRDWFKVDGMGGASLDDILANPDSPTNRVYYGVLTGQSNSASNDELLLLADNYRWYISEGIQAKAFASAKTGPIEHKIDTGARLHYDEVNRQHKRYSYQMTGATRDTLGRLESTGAPAIDTERNRGQTHALSLHLVDSLSFKSFTLTPGLRAEIVWTEFTDTLSPDGDNTRFQTALLPGAGLHYALTKELGFLGGIYRGFGPVAPEWHDEDSDVVEAEPESSITYEVGSRYASPLLHAELIGYFVDYQNLTANCSQGCSSDPVGTQFDGGEVNVYGLESLLARRWNVGNLTIPARASYALSLSAFQTSFSSANAEWGEVEEGDSLPYLPTHQATLGVGLEKEDRWGLDTDVTFVSMAREEAGSGPISDGVHTDAYAIVGIGARIRAVKYLWFYAKANNLFNSHYLASRRPHGARPGSPRWIQIGFKIEK